MDIAEHLEGAYAVPNAWQGEEEPERIAFINGVRIAYHVYGMGATKCLLLSGLACGHAFWGPYVTALTSINIPASDPNESFGDSLTQSSDSKIQLCTFDNRGVGSSSVPQSRSEYSTLIMAKDAIALMDHLGWHGAHVCGHSMGGMIACKMAEIAPGRVLSLSLISVTGGGYQCLPKLNLRTCMIAYRFLRAKTLEERVDADLDTHYTQEFLNDMVDGTRRRDKLFKEYVENMKESGMQPKHGLYGHMYACWMHSVTKKDIETIRSSGIPMIFIHGIHDVIAQLCYARALTKKFHCKMVELPAAHLVTHESTEKVVEVLRDLIRTSRFHVASPKYTIF